MFHISCTNCKSDIFFACFASTAFVVTDRDVKELEEARWVTRLLSVPSLMRRYQPAWASWPCVTLCSVLDQVYSSAWFNKADSPRRWTWLRSTWPCPAPSGLCVLTTLCRSGAPVARTSGSRCSSYIPSRKAWLLIWRKSLPESIMLFALNCESTPLQFVLLLNGGGAGILFARR